MVVGCANGALDTTNGCDCEWTILDNLLAGAVQLGEPKPMVHRAHMSFDSVVARNKCGTAV